MRIFTLTFVLCFILVSCGDSKQAQLENVNNACLEMGSTSIGFSGPSERMKIMKSYGFSPSIGATVNLMISGHQEAVQAWSFRPETQNCINRAFSCPVFLGIMALDEGEQQNMEMAAFAANYDKIITECM
jgi:hypothetical protein